MRTIFRGLLLWGGLWLMTPPAHAYEQAFPRTAVGVVEIKTIPPSTLLETRTDGSYFRTADGLFMRLFDYIRSHQVTMTVPVEASFEPAMMRFYVGASDASRGLASEGPVTVVHVPARKVAAIGGRGRYSEANLMRAREQLVAWLTAHPAYRATGAPYAVFWNSPFMPWFLRRFEIQVEVVPAAPDTPAAS